MHRSSLFLLSAAVIAPLWSGTTALAQTPCVNGFAGGYPCDNIDLLAHMTLAQLGASGTQPNAADLWGWTDPLTGREYAIIGLNNGTAFVDVTVPTAPVRIGNLPSHFATSNLWRDVDVAGTWCYIGSELAGHGLQVFDLTRLRNVLNPPVTFTEDAWTGVIGNSHTLYADKQHPYVYTVGTTSINNGGLTVFDVTNPLAPVLVGTHTVDGYIHENVVHTYSGPDPDHQGKQLSFNFHSGTPDKITIVDVTDKTDMNTLATITYSGARISHQGWLTEDQRYLLMNDEGDETQLGHGTRTRIFDLLNIDAPVFLGAYTAPIASVDHNLYVHRGAVYESNYTSGLRILDTAGVSAGTPDAGGAFRHLPAQRWCLLQRCLGQLSLLWQRHRGGERVRRGPLPAASAGGCPPEGVPGGALRGSGWNDAGRPSCARPAAADRAIHRIGLCAHGWGRRGDGADVGTDPHGTERDRGLGGRGAACTGRPDHRCGLL
ncbi:MAG: choice-of-anchor B family protein [Flavobacteriales bacterium]|nr:choice-of-anchor B family protein [Flavobacteriales bacterium]